MVEINLNIAHPEKNESYNETLDEDEAEVLHDYQLGDEVSGEELGFDGGTFEITGGSDRAGFPMRKDTPGIGRHKVLIKSGTGLRKNRKGRRVRRTVAGNMIYEETAQVNLKVVEDGSGLFEDEAEENAEEAADDEGEDEEPADEAESDDASSEEASSEDEESTDDEADEPETSDDDESEEEPSEEDVSAEEDEDDTASEETDSDEGEEASDKAQDEESSSEEEDENDSDEEAEKKSES